jgi:mRNA interferase HigB
MIVTGRRIAEEYLARHSGDRNIQAAARQYRTWLALARSAAWRTPMDVKADHPKVSVLKNGRIVFNISGNNYRLVSVVEFKGGILAIRFFGSHAEYDRINAETV